jgi:hypothetical protein
MELVLSKEEAVLLDDSLHKIIDDRGSEYKDLLFRFAQLLTSDADEGTIEVSEFELWVLCDHLKPLGQSVGRTRPLDLKLKLYKKLVDSKVSSAVKVAEEVLSNADRSTNSDADKGSDSNTESISDEEAGSRSTMS